MRVDLIRHGETDYNKEMRYQGQLDIELNETGINQALELAIQLDFTQISSIYCSDLVRSKHTLDLLLKDKGYNGKIEYTADIREKKLGELEGQLITGKQKIFQHGETRVEFYNRCAKFFDRLVESNMKWIIVVTHGGVIYNFFDWIENLYNISLNIKLTNCCVIRLDIDGDKAQVDKIY